MFKSTRLLVVLAIITLFGCKKEPTEWGTNWEAPVAYGNLTIADVVPSEYVTTNADGYLSLVVNESIFSFSIDTLIKLPDTTIIQKTAIGIPSIEVSPSFVLPDSYDQGYELDDIQLKRVIIESGQALASIASPWEGKTKITFTFPNVFEADGSTFQRVYYLDAGSSEVPATISDMIDMAGKDMDLTGTEGTEYNTIGIDIVVESNEETSTYVVTNADSISLSFQFKDMIPRYAKGYFGQHYFSDTMGVSLPFMNKVIAGNIDLDSIRLGLSIRNGFNIVGQAKISKLTGINNRTGNNVELDFPEKGNTININPASGGLYDYEPSAYPLPINNSNSNILAFLENLSDSIALGYEIEINPFGNVSGGSDEFFPNSTMDIYLDGEFPLSFGANELTIADTISIDYSASSNIRPEEGYFEIEYTNAFPMSANPLLILTEATGGGGVASTIEGTTIIEAANYDPYTYETTPKSGKIRFNLSQEQVDLLESTSALVLNIVFNTTGGEHIKITPETYFNFKLRTNFNINVSV